MHSRRMVLDKRFYFFNTENQYYCFDSYTHKIFTLSEELLFLLKNKQYKNIKQKYKKFYNKILIKKHFKAKVASDNNCTVTINLSNKCNLSCLYFYRDKKQKSELSNEELKKIIHYIITKYQPYAKQYIFSLSYTSESSFDLDKLKYFDFLIGENEGYLFSKKQISQKKALRIFKQLPKTIQEKYLLEKNYIERLNQILRNEKLWNIFNYSNNTYLVSTLSKFKNPSYSRSIMANRQILNYIFSKYKIETTINYFSMSFMTNATNISENYIQLLQSIFCDSIYVSLDGPGYIHNQNRKFHNGLGSFKDTIKGIEKLKAAGINVIPSAVITPQNSDLEPIISFFISLGFNKISFNLVRGKNITFTKTSIDILLNSIKKYFLKFFEDAKSNTISKDLLILKDTIIFTYLKQLYYRNYTTTRCTWGKDLVIDSKGNLYHCNSTIGQKEDFLGHFSDNKIKKQLMETNKISKSQKCKNCFAEYLCGGTCFAEKVFHNEQNQEMECYFHMELIKENLILYAKLFNNKLLDEFMKIIK